MPGRMRYGLLLAMLLAAALLLALSPAYAAVLETIENTVSNTLCLSTSNDDGQGQSFTVSQSGEITQVGSAPLTSGSTTLKLYAGAGNGGALLHSQQATWSGSGGMEMHTLSTPISVSPGSYTVYFGHNVQFRCSTNNPYGGGRQYFNFLGNSGVDLVFRVIVEDAVQPVISGSTQHTDVLVSGSAVSDGLTTMWTFGIWNPEDRGTVGLTLRVDFPAGLTVVNVPEGAHIEEIDGKTAVWLNIGALQGNSGMAVSITTVAAEPGWNCAAPTVAQSGGWVCTGVGE